MNPIAFVGIPHTGWLAADSLEGLSRASVGGVPYCITKEGSSCLTRNFNQLILHCRNMDPMPKFFGLHHSDIVAQPGWLDVLLTELADNDADIVSTVIPIKDERGLTTTGAFDAERRRIKRFTMRELERLPPTFTAPPGQAMAINTGLFMMRTDRPWFSEIVFRFEDDIAEREGKTIVLCRSEDWLFSEFLHERGARVFATSKVRATHVGYKHWKNWGAWGELDKDVPGWWR